MHLCIILHVHVVEYGMWILTQSTCRLGELEFSKYLVSKNVDLSCKDNHGRTSVHWACRYVQKVHDISYITILYCRWGELSFVKDLMRKQVTVNDQDLDGSTPVILACK